MIHSGSRRELSRYLTKRNIPEEVMAFIEHTAEPLCVACSGGSDSLALLLLTKLFWPKRTVVILHYNHRIRAVSDEEERQMIRLAHRLDVKIEVGHRPVTTEPHSSETINPHHEHATTASGAVPLRNVEKTPDCSFPTDRLSSPASEHGVPCPQSLLPSQTTDTVPRLCPPSLPSFLPRPSRFKSDGSLTEIPSEANLRTMRYAFFEKMLRLHNSNILLLGHHADDRLETVLMRLMRGVGLEGLIAPRALHKVSFYTKVRPLLNFSKNELRDALVACNIPFFEDTTNGEDDCLRNRIRHHLIPAFDKVFPSHWRNGFKRSCCLLSEQRDDLKQYFGRCFQNWDFSRKAFKRSDLRVLSTAECRYFFQTWLQQHKVRNFGSQTTDTVLSALHAEETAVFPLDPEHRLCLSDTTVALITQATKQPPNASLTWRNGTLFLPNGARLSFKEEHCSPEHCREVTSGAFSDENCVVLDAEMFTLPRTVRFRQNGDRYRPLGATQSVKVKDLFSNRKIPLVFRHQLPVICSANGDIAWIPGLPPADAFKLTPQTKRCVFLFYQTDKILYGKENGGEEENT